jgi:hypothetical protein
VIYPGPALRHLEFLHRARRKQDQVKSNSRKCYSQRQGCVGHVPLFGQKLINIDQQIVARKSTLVAITVPSAGT